MGRIKQPLNVSYEVIAAALSEQFSKTYYFRKEVEELLKIGRDSFYRYLKILVGDGKKDSGVWSSFFEYQVGQRQWSDYQVYCLSWVKALFRLGLTTHQVRSHIAKNGIIPPEEVTNINN